MKTLFSLLSILAFTGLGLYAQTPNVINYQASIKDENGKPLANETVSVSINITTNGGSFSDTQSATTNDFGVVNLQLGGPALKAIDWSKGGSSYSISVSSNKGNIDLGSFNMATVPYALYAEKSEALYLALLPNINGMAPPSVLKIRMAAMAHG